jgi:hypothetical protein
MQDQLSCALRLARILAHQHRAFVQRDRLVCGIVRMQVERRNVLRVCHTTSDVFVRWRQVKA